jgi:hypothetical protein
VRIRGIWGFTVVPPSDADFGVSRLAFSRGVSGAAWELRYHVEDERRLLVTFVTVVLAISSASELS